jgi:hypothetical protein
MQTRAAVTIRFPDHILAKARAIKNGRESLNDFVIEAVDREIRRRQVLEAHAEIMRIRETVKARTGLHEDSVPYIRSLRDGSGRRE